MKLAVLDIGRLGSDQSVGKALDELCAQKFTVLVADDSPDDQLFAKRGLASSCVLHQVGAVTDGVGVRDYLLGNGRFANRALFPFPDLLLLDLDMPRMSGLQVLSWIQARKAPPPRIVVLSGTPDPAKAAAALRLGADYFQAKTGDPQMMRMFVRRLELLMILLAGREPPKPKITVSKTIPLVDARSADWEEGIRSAADTKMNFVLILNDRNELDKLWSTLGTTSVVPDKLERWGIIGMAEALSPGDYELLLQSYRKEAVYLIEQLTLNRNMPPRTRAVILYCELRGIVSEHHTVEEAGLSLLEYLSSFSHAKLLPLAGIYEFRSDAWRRVKKLSSN